MLSKEQLEKIANQGPVDIGGAQNPIVTEMATELLSLREQYKSQSNELTAMTAAAQALRDEMYKCDAKLDALKSLPRHVFSVLVNELRDVPAVGCKRELIVGVLNRHGVSAEMCEPQAAE